MVRITQKLIIVAFAYCTMLSAVWAQIPKFGNDTLIDVGCWNIEWFGHSTNGPSNKELQFTNVLNVIRSTDIDVWGFQEISNSGTFRRLMDSLPAYSDAVATFSQTQRTALIWKNDLFDFISAQHILNTSQFSFDFAGRPPLEVVLRTKNTPVIDTLYFYVVHLKAISDAESYTRRKNSSQHMKTFFDANRTRQKIFVIGDWNDDLIFPTWSGATESPFKNFVDDSLNYYFPSIELTRAGKVSYGRGSGRAMIDHHLINKPLFDYYVANSARVLDTLTRLVTNFVNTTSDHFPVLSFYNFNKDTTTTPPLSIRESISGVSELKLWPNPSNGVFYLDIPVSGCILHVYDLSGRLILSKQLQLSGEYRIELQHVLGKGAYLLKLQDRTGYYITKKLMIE